MPLIRVSGSETVRLQGALQPMNFEQSRRSRVKLHTVDAAAEQAIDPLTYEVIRHRLSAITDDMGNALKRMSGSVVVTDCNDFCAAMADETGDLILVGQYNTQLGASMDMAIKWTLEHRSENPGLRPATCSSVTIPGLAGVCIKTMLACSRRSSTKASFSDGAVLSAIRSTLAAYRREAGR